ncbi:hypothetical protein KAR10_10380, partial [bacterium]|nr:hypothetical protein [bacterium]
SEREENREKLYNDITCYDKKTEILTKHGFKFFNDVSYDDEIATLNQDTGYLEYHKPTAKQKYMYEGKMYKIKTKYLDLKITPDHELYTIRPNNGGVKHSGWGGKQIQDVVKDKMYFTVKKDSGWEGKQKKYFMLPGIITNPNGRNKRVITQKKIPMDLWVKFFGWYITEGSLDKNIKKGYKISIRQCNLKNKKEIYDIAKDMGYNVFDIKDGSVQFYDKQLYTYLTQFGYSGDKFIPTEIKNLNKELLSELILTMFKGDGCIKDGKLLSYYTKSKRLIDDVQELLLKTGKACKTYKRRNIYELSVNHKYLTIKYPHHRWKNKITTVDTKEYVYDVTVPNHIIYVKRNGIASWQKNCLGYGDGINQLKTKIFHATDNRTYLTVAMTKNGTETITVADTTSFDATGDLWIGCEKVSYTGKTGTTFTGITRSVAFADKTDVVESYVHTKFIEVYDAQYTRTSAETDSSIGDGTELNDANWGINEQTFTDKTIIDQDTLDKIAYYLLLQHKDVVISITLNPMEIYDTMKSVELGDVVTINDTDLGVTGAEYRIIGIELGRDNAVPYITIKCSTSYMNVTDIISRMESESKSLTSYMQGSPSVVSVQSYENAQYSATPEDKAMKMKFRVWDKTIAITDARLDFKVLPFRGYTSTTSSTTTADGTNIVSNTFNASGLAYVTYHKLDWVDLVVIGSPVKIPTAIIDEHVVDYTSGRY